MDIYTIADGNIGALTFLMDAINKDPIRAGIAMNKVGNNNIVGDKLYMLWSDCCDRDTFKTLDVIIFHTIKDIEEHINYEHGRGIPYINE